MGRGQVGGIHRFPCQTWPKRCGEELTQKGIGHREKYIGGWRKRSTRPKEKIISCRWKRDQYREKLISCWTQRTPFGALRGQRWWEREFKTYEVRSVVFQFLESTRSGTPRYPWMKGEPTPVWDHGTRGSSPFWLGEGRVPRGNMATPEAVVFGVGEPGFLQAGRGSAVGKTAQSTTAPPLRSFKFFTVVETSSDCCNMAQGPINWLAQDHRAQSGVNRCTCICLLVGTSGKGLGRSLKPVVFNWFQFTFNWFQFTFNWFQFTFSYIISSYFQLISTYFQFSYFQFTFNNFNLLLIAFNGFVFSFPTVGAHNRVPSRQLYYSVTEHLMRYTLEKLPGCCS